MKNFWRFTVNIDSGVFEDDEQVFRTELYSLPWLIGYHYPHFFSGNSITSYGSFIIELKSLDNIEYIESIYWVHPTYIISEKNKEYYHLIFDTEIGIPKDDFTTVAKMLEFIYDWKSILYSLYQENDLAVDKIKMDGPKFSSISFFKNLSLVINTKWKEQDVSKNDLLHIENINNISIKEVSMILGNIDDRIDELHNVSPVYGNTYDYIINNFPLPSEWRDWMNKNYGTEFVNYVDINKYSKDWEKIIEGRGFLLDDIGYYIAQEWEKKRQTDFFIRVHYKIIKPSETVYIVSLVNDKMGDISKKIEWTNTSSKWLFAEFLQKLGNFHFTGAPNFISLLHSKISEYKNVPEICAVYGYGFHRDLDIMILDNGIFDLKQKIFTKKEEDWTEFMFNYNGQWFLPVGKQGESIANTMNGMVPRINGEKLIEIWDALSFLDTIYNDYSGKLMLMMAMSNMGYGMFGDPNNDNQRYPMFFVRGLSGNGKSTYTEMMQRCWGLHKSARNFTETTSFTMSMYMVYLKHCPLFFSEFRQWAGVDIKAKASFLRSMFDETAHAKGRPDQTVLTYDFKSTMIIDWQEMFNEEAIQTRTIQLRFLASHKIKWDFDTLMRKWVGILDNVLYTYLNLASKEKYYLYMDEWYKLFRKSSINSRICDNLKMIYAGCMAVDSKNKDMYLNVLNKIGTIQTEELNQNGDAQQIINSISKFLEYWYGNDVYANIDNVIISWSAFEDYMRTKRIDLSLKLDTYKEHLEEMWFPVQFSELSDQMIYGITIPKSKIPKQFLVNKIMYAAFRSYNHD